MKNNQNQAIVWYTNSLKMKVRLSIFLFFAFIFTAAANSFSQTQISLNVENEKIVKILDEIEAMTEFKFIYRLDIYDFDKKVTIKVQKELIKNVLDQLFENQIDYNILDKKVLLKKKVPAVQPAVDEQPQPEVAQKIITGTVNDEDGNPLPGATVLELGTQNGTVTDFEGNFSLVLENDNSSLEISYVGYQKQFIAAGDQNELTVNLKAGASDLDEIVVTGYTSSSKRNLTGAISKINTEDLQCPLLQTSPKGYKDLSLGWSSDKLLLNQDMTTTRSM